MNVFRSIAAVLLALVVASPLCCCAGESVSSTQRHSCCSRTDPPDSKRKNDDGHACLCKSKEPRDSAKHLTLPTAPPVADLPSPQGVDIHVLPLAGDAPVAVRNQLRAPPGSLLVWYSRWLI
ncbi:MAG: hypothetical protein H7A49_01830 [Akkermansiaceae bacterium]|nr:hypothetical protein [Akkermansiaceae bacterium]MCP5542626.1 hypothetical protein [Akkermansiaceae bacterium]MCP5548261.1 hypothetical protein [Akkermansiaceae bacterium]